MFAILANINAGVGKKSGVYVHRELYKNLNNQNKYFPHS